MSDTTDQGPLAGVKAATFSWIELRKGGWAFVFPETNVSLLATTAQAAAWFAAQAADLARQQERVWPETVFKSVEGWSVHFPHIGGKYGLTRERAADIFRDGITRADLEGLK